MAGGPAADKVCNWPSGYHEEEKKRPVWQNYLGVFKVSENTASIYLKQWSSTLRWDEQHVLSELLCTLGTIRKISKSQWLLEKYEKRARLGSSLYGRLVPLLSTFLGRNVRITPGNYQLVEFNNTIYSSYFISPWSDTKSHELLLPSWWSVFGITHALFLLCIWFISSRSKGGKVLRG